jgi:hypothetical protein
MEYKYAKHACKRRPRPETWLHGPDPLTHEKFYAWHKHRAQARYRKEDYELTIEQWFELWSDNDKFLNRGRKPDEWVLTRKDSEGAWSVSNVEIITRYDQLCRNMAEKVRARWGNPGKKKN